MRWGKSIREALTLLALFGALASPTPVRAQVRVLDPGAADASDHLVFNVADRASAQIGTVTETASQRREPVQEARAVDVSTFGSDSLRDRSGTVTRSASEREASGYTARSGKVTQTIESQSAPPEIFRTVGDSGYVISNQ